MLKQAEREVWGLVWKDRTLFPVLFPAVMGDTQDPELMDLPCAASWHSWPPNLLYSWINVYIYII